MSDFRARRLSDLLDAPRPIVQAEATNEQVPTHPMSIAFPLYIYPLPDAWTPLFTAIERNQNIIFNLIVNPNNGPGAPPLPDTNYIQNLAKLNSHSNVHLFGYIHTTWGARPLAAIEADLAVYGGWAQHAAADIHVDGVFLDEAPSDLKFIAYMKSIAQATKAALGSQARVWGNPGVPVDAAFYAVVDVVNACENSWEFWAKGGGREGVSRELRARSTVMVHGFSGAAGDLEGVVLRLVRAGFCAGLITTDQSYTAFCPLWDTFVGCVAVANETMGSGGDGVRTEV